MLKSHECQKIQRVIPCLSSPQNRPNHSLHTPGCSSNGAGEPPDPSLTSEDLASRITTRNPACQAIAFPSFDALEHGARELLNPADCLIIFGGGPLFTMGTRLAEAMRME